MIALISDWVSQQLGDVAIIAAGLAGGGVFYKYVILPIWTRFISPIILKNTINPLIRELTEGDGELSGPFREGINQIIESQLSPLVEKVEKVFSEVTPNGGGSIKDIVGEIYKNQEYLITELTTFKKQIFANSDEQRKRWRVIAAHSPVSLYETDENGVCIFVNAKWQELTGLTIAEGLGEGWIDAIHPDYRDDLLGAWKHAIEAQSDFGPVDYAYLRKGVQPVYVRGFAHKIIGSDGKVLGWIGTVIPRNIQEIP